MNPSPNKVKRRKVAPKQPVLNSLSERIRQRLQNELNDDEKAALDNALRLASKKKLGRSLTQEEILDVVKRTTDPAVASRVMADVSGTQDKNSYKILARVAIGMAIVAVGAAGIAAASAASSSTLPILLGAYFVNRVLDDPTSMVARLNQIAPSIEDRVGKLFNSWWSTLDVPKIKDIILPRSESGQRITFKDLASLNPMSNKQLATMVLVKRSGRDCGVIRWDPACGTCSPRSTGWVVTLFDGFNESAFHSGPSANKNEPFTAIHRGEIKLHNPSRMTLDMARTWTKSALRA